VLQGRYDPTPVQQTQEELRRQEFIDKFLTDDEPPVEWTFDYFFGLWKNDQVSRPWTAGVGKEGR
jgi:hypothetical protein